MGWLSIVAEDPEQGSKNLTAPDHSDRIGSTINKPRQIPLAGIAQLVEHFTENEGVPSSSLGPGIGSDSNRLRECGRGSVVERLLAKEKATGSNPVARSE